MELLTAVFMGLFFHAGELSSLTYMEVIFDPIISIVQGQHVVESLLIFMVFVLMPVLVFLALMKTAAIVMWRG